jgi:hypothetical protein
MNTNLRRFATLMVCILAWCWIAATAYTQDLARMSKTIGDVLRQPLPPEELSLSESASELIIAGPTFTYRVSKATGAILAIRVVREGHTVIESTGPVDIQVDRYRLTSDKNVAKLSVASQGKDKIVLKVEGTLHDPEKSGPDLDCTAHHTFYNDGVVVSEVKLTPRADLPVEKSVTFGLLAKGHFDSYLHKRRDENGDQAVRGRLPEPGKSVRQSTLTSCLQVFSPDAAMAIFTDCGATHQSQKDLDTALVEVIGWEEGATQLALAQYLVHVAPGDKPYLLKGGDPFVFRVGISLAPNRLPHPRTHDLRMFTWIGDAKYPYPTDEEIAGAARLGFTLFQMHRAGTPGEPRPPAGEIDRVVKNVHEAGMLFLWEENPDLLYANAPGVQKLQVEGRWSLWQGFNYGGRYKASMDPYCDLIATCLAAPNGQDEYRLANIRRMMDKLPVDGLFLDDNLPYNNCTLWKEHGHPRPVYDCLIELHDMNWRRRELMRSRCPHLVLVSHNANGFILPTVCDFDAQIYGEGRSFSSVEDYWNDHAAPVMALHAQGMIWPGDDEAVRCATAIAYNHDLLTGGGQYNEIDWRVYAKKLPYAKGVTDREMAYVKTYNLAQYYFGLYESKPWYFATSADLFKATTPLTYATIYHNQIGGDWLIAVANMSNKPLDTSVNFRSPQTLGIEADKPYVLFDVLGRTTVMFQGDKINQGFDRINVPGENLRLFYLRLVSGNAPCHLWGGKRMSETWDEQMRKLTVEVHGPAGLQDAVFLWPAKHGIQRVVVAGGTAEFSFDSAQGLANGLVTFTSEPVMIEVFCSPDGTNHLPEKPVAAIPLR